MSQDQTLDGENNWFAHLLEEYGYTPPKRGQVLEGEVLNIGEKLVTVDIGSKRDAVVPLDDIEASDDDRLNELSAGDQVPVYVTRPYAADGKLLASIKKGFEMEDWQRAEACFRSGEVLDLEVIGSNRGGLKVAFGELEGFVPNSLIPSVRRVQDQDVRESRKNGLVGSILCVKVIEVIPQRQRLILSARAAQEIQRRRRLDELEIGQIVEGPVVNLVDFGAFVDLGGVDGLIHLSELSWERVKHPSQVVALGDVIEVSIEDVDLERGRVSLSRKPLLPNPWKGITDRYQIGDLVEGVISNVCDFGAFVKFKIGIEGLVHISEMEIPSGSSIEDVVHLGDDVLTKIVSLDPVRERIGLSIRRVSEGEQLAWMDIQVEREAVNPSERINIEEKIDFHESMRGEVRESEEEDQQEEV